MQQLEIGKATHDEAKCYFDVGPLDSLDLSVSLAQRERERLLAEYVLTSAGGFDNNRWPHILRGKRIDHIHITNHFTMSVIHRRIRARSQSYGGATCLVED